MPGTPRRRIYNPRVKTTIHAWNGFARDLYMIGNDHRTQEDNGHRLPWVREVESIFARYFAIEVRASAIMENHIHEVLTNRPDLVKQWSDRDVVTRWLTITKLKISGGALEIAPKEERIEEELLKGKRHIARLRKRLADFSWFMGALCENISRHINREEGRKGTCWQGRFQCRVAKDDDDALTMMMYVDLNPLRAAMVEKIEDSDRCSAGLRMQAWQAELRDEPFAAKDYRAALWLAPIERQRREKQKRPLDDPMYVRAILGKGVSDGGMYPFSQEDYFRTLDELARVPHPGKRGVTPSDLPPILERIRPQTDG